MVLTPLSKQELYEKFFTSEAQNIIKYFLAKAAFAQPEILDNQSPIPFQVAKEHIEQWVVQALGVKPIGAGSYPVDVIKDNEWGADVKMLSCKIDDSGNLVSGESGETSLAQKFKSTGSNLDDLFKNRKYNEIRNGWCEILQEKLNKVIADKNLKNIYYLFILRAGNRFHICGLKVDVNKITQCSVAQKTINSVSTPESVWLDDFIDNALGSIKIYKAKKRLELRLKPLEWQSRNLFITFTFLVVATKKNIKDIIKNQNDLQDHITEILNSSFSIFEDWEQYKPEK